jgi:DNA-directed RNA polymerase specialized sigma24 family protein
MTAQSGQAREPFEVFLQWLSVDRESALKKHDEIMRKINKYFVRKGCAEPEELAAETRDRVIKITGASQKYPNPDALFFSVASKVWHESLRKPKTEPLPSDDLLPVPKQETEEKERMAACLEKCLAQLPDSDRDTITRYYQDEGRAAINARKALMAEQGGDNTLRVRAHRIRIKLRTCMRACMEK